MPKGRGKGYSSLTEEDKNRIVEMFLNGTHMPDIAKQFPCTDRAVTAVLRERSIYTLRKNRYTLNESYFDHIDTERQAYWLGFIAADGCITSTNYFVFSLSEPDQDKVYELAQDLEYTGKVRKIIKERTDANRRPQYRINLSSASLCETLRNLNICEHKNQRTNLPVLPDKLIRHFIRGMFDGDGTFVVSQSTCKIKNKIYQYDTCRAHIACGNNIIGTELQQVIYDGIKYLAPIHKHSTKECWYVSLYKKQALENFYHWMYDDATIFLQRKKDKWDTFMSAYKE